MTPVRDAMTTEVVTVGPEVPVRSVIATMLQAGVSGMPVVDGTNRVIGVVTEADVVARRAHEPTAPRLLSVVQDAMAGHHNRWRQKADGALAGDVMTVPAHTVGPDDDLRRAAARMVTLALKRLPVVDADGRLVGIISQRDILRRMFRGDDEIERSVGAALRRLARTTDVRDVRVATSDGVVTLSGRTASSEDAQRIASAVHDIDGVVTVDDQLVVGAGAETTSPGR